jgi:hypothetical protein
MIWGRKRRNDRAQALALAGLNELVLRGVILSFETNFESHKADEPHRAMVMVETDDALRRERIWLQVRQALEPLGAGVEMRMERVIPDTRDPNVS